MLSDEEICFRMSGIGGSDAAAVCGVSRYKTRLGVYLDKIGASDPVETNQYMHWGNILEPVIISEYEKIKGVKVRAPDEYMINQSHPYIIGKADGIVDGKDILIECKTASSDSGWGEPGTDQVPIEYLMQCAHYAYLYNASTVDIAVLVRGSDFRIYTYNRNKKLEENLIRIESEFWNNYVLKDIPPDPATKSEVDYFYKCSGKSIVADMNIDEDIHILHELNNKKKLLDKEIQSKKDKISFYMKDAEELISLDGSRRVTYKPHARKSLDTSAIKNKFPDIAEDNYKMTEIRPIKLY